VPRVSWLLLLAVTLATPSALGQASGADAAIERGVRLREQGKDDEALAEFQRAYEESPTPRARAQMGLAEQALGQWVAADRDLRGATETHGDTWIESRRSVLESALKTIAGHLGSLEVRGKGASGDVYVDGVKVGTLPMEGARRVEVGTRTLEVRAPGFYPVSRPIIVLPGETTRETLDLVALPAVGPLPAASPHAESRALAAAEAPQAASNGPSRALAIVGFGLAGASLALAFVGLAERASEISAYNADATCPGEASATQPAACADRLSSASTWRTVSIASFIGAGAFTATAVTLLVTAPKRPTATRSLACRGGFGTVGCSLSF